MKLCLILNQYCVKNTNRLAYCLKCSRKTSLPYFLKFETIFSSNSREKRFNVFKIFKYFSIMSYSICLSICYTKIWSCHLFTTKSGRCGTSRRKQSIVFYLTRKPASVSDVPFEKIRFRIYLFFSMAQREGWGGWEKIPEATCCYIYTYILNF